MAQRIDFPIFSALTNAGLVASGYRLFVYKTGTTTKVSLYKDPLFSATHANPVTLTAYGRATGDYPIYFNYSSVDLVLAPPPVDPLDPDDPPTTSVWTVEKYTGPGTASPYYHLSELTGDIGDAAGTLNALNANCTLVVDQTITLTESVSFDAEVTVVNVPGHAITMGGYTLTFNGPLIACPGAFVGTGSVVINGYIDAGNYRIFADTVTVTYGDDQIINDRWEDATGDAYYPSITDTIDLGKSTKKFRDLHLNRNANIGGILTLEGNADLNGDVDIAGALTLNGSALVPNGYASGATVSNAADADHDITIAAGTIFRDSTNTHTLSLTSALTKQIDATWAAGTNAGGLYTDEPDDTPNANTWHHLFLIRKDSDGSIDAYFDISTIAANKPAGYTYYAYIFSVLTNGSANILPFTHKYNRWVFWSSPTLDIDVSDQGTSAVARTLPVPPISGGTLVLLNVLIDHATAANVYLSQSSETDMAPSITAAPLATIRTTSSYKAMSQVLVGADVLSRIFSRSDVTSTTVKISVLAYYDPRSR